jgi:protocatechuate 3,4-dioxygenase beta subunit
MRNSLSLLMLSACALHAQAPGEIKPAAVQGVVTNAVTGEPVVRVHVSLWGAGAVAANATPPNYGALTDAEGKFRITGVTPNAYSVAYEKTGFLMPVENAIGGRGTFVTLTPGDEKSELKLKLMPTGVITGRVLDAGGEPVERVRMMAYGSTTNGSITDEQGRFRLGGLSPGRYRICAQYQDLAGLPPEIRSDGTKEVHYTQTCYPGALPADATPAVEVRPAAEASGIEIRLIQMPVVRVSGKVMGAPAGSTVQITLGGRTTLAKPDGSYEVWRADPGRYTATAVSRAASAGGGRGSPQITAAALQSAPVEVEVSTSNVDHVDLMLMAPFELSGLVEYEDEAARPPAAPQAQQAQPQQAQPQPMVRPRQLQLTAMQGNAGSRYVNLAEDGSFKIDGLTADRYRVSTSLQNAYVKSMNLGPVPIDGTVLDVRTGSAGLPLRVVLSSGLADVAGKVEGDPAATAGKYAALIAEDGSMQARFARSADGTYSFKVPPGRYLLFLVDESERNRVMQDRNPGVTFADRVARVELKAKETVKKDLK